ncbi:putative signal peptide-containing protein [Cryptosporidium canis]|uniref:Signal peptide-containing protein n=1 Tax=Cryptosporidium canis TaxID=195482 RepID=A0A9D5DJ92_9CRYT|nr:putative signal peptide-containing protein [Cryptosporidium canis]
MIDENERKILVNNFLIRINIRAWFFWVIYFCLAFLVYFSIDYLYILEKSLSGVLKTSYLLYSFRSSFLKLKKENHLSSVLISISGLAYDDLEILKERIFLKRETYIREILLDKLSVGLDGGSYGLLLKTFLNGSDHQNLMHSFPSPIENHFEAYMESVDQTSSRGAQPLYSVTVSFKNCGDNSLENTIHVYNSRISLFCLNSEITKSDFFIILNDLFDAWFLKFTEDEPEMAKYTSLYLSMYNLLDLDINKTSLLDIKRRPYYSAFESFISQINGILHVDLSIQNKYISNGSLDAQDDQKAYHRLTYNFNDKNYNYFDKDTFVLQIFNHFSSSNDSLGDYFVSESRDFLLTHYDTGNSVDSQSSPEIAWISTIKSLALPKNYRLNFKSRLNNVTFKSHIETESRGPFLLEWQISVLKLINKNYILHKILYNTEVFLSAISLYNVLKLPNNVIYAIDHMRNIVSNINAIDDDYLSTVLKNSNDLLFNPEIHNKKTFNQDLIMAIYSPVALPVFFIIIISLFRVVKHSKMKFN